MLRFPIYQFSTENPMEPSNHSRVSSKISSFVAFTQNSAITIVTFLGNVISKK